VRITKTYTGSGWTKAQVERLTDLFNQGLRVKDIAVGMQKTIPAIRNKMIYLGLYRNKSSLSPETEKDIANRLRAGEYPMQIRKALGTSPYSIKRVQMTHSIDAFSSPRLTSTQAAYLAGIIDGEGCIMLSWRSGMRLPQIVISVTNTHFGLIDYINRMAGCGSSLDAPKKGNRRPQRRWMSYQRCAVEFVRQIRPYMICKVGQADIICRYYEAYIDNRTWDLSEQDLTDIRMMVQEIHCLNKRGVN